MILIISCSLNPGSRSRVVAQYASQLFDAMEVEHQFVDLAEHPLPICDADSCYLDPRVNELGEQIRTARGVLLACPIYNYDVSSAAKNLVELTGQAWRSTVVGFVCAAGGRTSYMSLMGLANSLMLDFRSFIIPRFVYVTGEDFEGNSLVDEDSQRRVQELLDDLVRVSNALAQ